MSKPKTLSDDLDLLLADDGAEEEALADDDNFGLGSLSDGDAAPATPRARKAKKGAKGNVATAVDAVAKFESEFTKAAKREKAQRMLTNDTEHWTTFCFETREQKELFLTRNGLIDLGDKHIDGIEAARRLGTPFSDDELVKWPTRRTTRALAEMADGDGQ